MQMFTRSFLLAFSILLTACSEFPKDPDSTLATVRAHKAFRVGVLPTSSHSHPAVAEMLKGLTRSVHASPQLIEGETESLLNRLEDGKLELVITTFEKKSPWADQITIGPALERYREGKTDFVLAPAMRNGENGWIAVVEREARNATVDPA